MGRATATQASFNGGELSPRMRGRVDQGAYAIGCETMLGFFPAMQGPAIAMPGTMFVATAAAPFRAIPFEYDVEQSYAIEASDHKFRFYTGNGRLETAPGVAYEIATPWSYAQVLELDWHQSLDVLYLVHPEVPPHELRRIGPATFALVSLALNKGPFADGNADELLQVSASAATGTVTLTGPEPGFFAAGDVGSLFQLEAGDYNAVGAWEPAVTVTAGETKASDGKVYEAKTTGRTGSVQPIHIGGAEYDGMASGTNLEDEPAAGVLWEYLHGRYGLLRIKEVPGDGSAATADVLQRLPTGYDEPTWRWARGAFSARRGWPEAVTIWNERLTFGTRATLHGSVVGGYDDFGARDEAGDFQRDRAFTVRLPNPNRIRWLAADRRLVIGTARAEHAAEQLQVQTGSAGPPVIEVQTQSTYGAKKLRPVLADGRVLFVQRAGRKVHELGYAIASDRYEAPDMTRLADHLGAAGFGDLAWVQEPDRQLWAVQDNGALAAMTYSPSQEVFGWSRRELGGGVKARSICAVTDPAGTRDQLWIAAQAPNGAWWMLRAMPLREDGDPVAAAFYVDAGLSYLGAMGGGAIRNGRGLQHLAGMTVTALCDGKPHRDIVVGNDGKWSIDYPATTIHIGLPYAARLTLLSPEAGGERGTAQGRIKRVTRVTLRLRETLGVRVSVQGLPAQFVETRTPADKLDQATPLYSGDFRIDTGGDFEPGGRVTIERFQPVPATVLAVFSDVETAS